MVKFDNKSNFGVWRYEVMDALTASNLEDTLRLEKKRETTTEEDWDKMNRTACGLIRSCLTQDIKYLIVLHKTSARQLWEILNKVSDKKYRIAVAVEEKTLSFLDEERMLH